MKHSPFEPSDQHQYPVQKVEKVLPRLLNESNTMLFEYLLLLELLSTGRRRVL